MCTQEGSGDRAACRQSRIEDASLGGAFVESRRIVFAYEHARIHKLNTYRVVPPNNRNASPNQVTLPQPVKDGAKSNCSERDDCDQPNDSGKTGAHTAGA